MDLSDVERIVDLISADKFLCLDIYYTADAPYETCCPKRNPIARGSYADKA